jgi:hypothetical protein
LDASLSTLNIHKDHTVEQQLFSALYASKLIVPNISIQNNTTTSMMSLIQQKKESVEKKKKKKKKNS